jgi:hypothetical protein
MTARPRHNEDRFYRYPTRRVVAVVDETAQLDAALHALEAGGVDVSGVNVLSGAEGLRLLDRKGVGHGLRSRLVRLLQRGAYEMDALRDHERALKDGHHLIYVPVRSRAEADKVTGLLHGAGGYYVLYFWRWSVEKPPA